MKLLPALLGNVIRHLLTLLISFFAAKHVLGEEVARKLNAGDTVDLWGGAIHFSSADLVNTIAIASTPLLVPIVWGTWLRIRDKYKILVASAARYAMSAEQLHHEVKQTSTVAMIEAVATQKA